jgi:hypothetical protein
MSAVLFAQWLLGDFALLRGIYALNKIASGLLKARDIRRGRFSGNSRERAKKLLRFELLTIVAAAKLGQSSYDLSGADAFVDALADAMKEEIAHEAKSWE